MNRPARGLFIAGTDTEVGKTYVATLIVRSLVRQGHRVGVYKPTASGCRLVKGEIVASDAVALWEAADQPGTLEQVCPQCFAAPLAPPRAAEQEGRTVDTALLREGLAVWSDQCEIIVVEGIGGLMSPISDDDYVADLAIEFGYPLIIVAPNKLGTINQTLQTLITATAYEEGIDVAGIVLNNVTPDTNDASLSTNLSDLQQRCIPPLLAHVAHGQQDLPETVDYFDLAGSPSNS